MRYRLKTIFTILLFASFSGTSFSQNSNNVALVGRWTEGACDAVFVEGNFAYIGNENTLQIIDVSDASSPASAGLYPTGDVIRGIYVSGDYAYVCAGASGMRILNISTPASITETGFYDLATEASGVYVLSNYAYLADGYNGLRIIDVSAPDSPTEVQSVSIEGNAENVVVVNDYAYLAASYGGMISIDVSNPDFPIAADTLQFNGDAFDVKVSGNHAYVACSFGGLRIVDLSNPTAMTEIGYFNAIDNAMGVDVSGNFTYVAAADSGLNIIDVSNPNSLTSVGFYDTEGIAAEVHFTNHLAYVADGDSGLYILRLQSRLSLSKTAVDFGAVEINRTANDTIVVGNVANNNLIIDSTKIGGADANEFNITQGGGDTAIIQPADSFKIGLSFSPQNQGNRSAFLIFYSNADTSPDTVALSGVGTEADMVVSPLNLNFGNVRVGNTTIDSVNIKNNGTAELAVGNINLTGVNSDRFAVDTTPFSIVPNDSQLLTVSFTPISVANFFAVLNLSSNGGDTNVVLAGNGVASELTVSPQSLNFGNVTIGDMKNDSLTIKNTGNAELNVSSLRIRGTNSNNFAVDTTSFSLPPGDSLFLRVRFSPNSSANFSALLDIFSDGGDNTISLRGNGAAPVLSFSRQSILFGVIPVNYDTSQTITVTNSGNTDLTIDSTKISGTNPGEFTLISGTGAHTLIPSANFDIRVRFFPQTEGAKSAWTVVYSNANTSPDSVRVTGFAQISQIRVEPDTTATAGESLTLNVTPPPNFTPTTTRLYYRHSREDDYQFIELTPSDTIFQGVIPPDSITVRGIEYYVYLSDGRTVVTHPAVNPQNNPIALQVMIHQYQYPLSLPEMKYKMISIPMELNNPAIADVLIDYGFYDIKCWRLLRWSEIDTSNVEYPGIRTAFTPGTAFWLITRMGEFFHIRDAMSMDASQPYQIILQPGWNQIGNPFAFPVAWADVTVPDSVEAPVFYNGNNYQYGEVILRPWEGYFVLNRDNIPLVISIPPKEAISTPPKVRTNAETEYTLQLSAKMADTDLVDMENYIGLASNAALGKDKLDFSEAPPIGDFLELSIIENDQRFAGNFKPYQGEGQQWEIEVRSSVNIGKRIHFTMHEFGKLPADFNLYILDEDYHCTIPTTSHKFTMQFNKNMPARQIKMIIGTKQYAKNHRGDISLVPIPYQLKQNFPNPFNPETTIMYQLGKREHVVLEIYNVAGQTVRTLVNKVQAAGQYTVLWNGLDNSGQSATSGIYLYKIQAGKFTAVKKFVLIR